MLINRFKDTSTAGELKSKKIQEQQVKEDNDGLVKDGKSEEGFISRTVDKMKHFYQEKIKGTYDNIDYKTKKRIAGTAIGAGVGVAAAVISSNQQKAQEVTITRTYEVPKEYTKNIGQVPSSWNQHDMLGDWGAKSHAHDYAPNGWDNVTKTAPVLDSTGEPVMMDKTETLNSNKYGNNIGAGILYTVIGAVSGFLGTVALEQIASLNDKE